MLIPTITAIKHIRKPMGAKRTREAMPSPSDEPFDTRKCEQNNIEARIRQEMTLETTLAPIAGAHEVAQDRYQRANHASAAARPSLLKRNEGR